MSEPHNPLAFPLPDQYTPDGRPIMQGWHGMSLRDWFAGQALAGMMANSEAVHVGAEPANSILFGQNGQAFAGQIAAILYVVADAMLSARAKGGADE